MEKFVQEENFLYKYLVLELFEKLYRLKKYIKSCAKYDRKNSDKRIIKLFFDSISIIGTEVNDLCSVINEKIDESSELAVIVKLSQCAKAINKIHEELRNIHSSWILPEIKTFANEVTRKTDAGKVPVYIILSDNYSFLERNLGRKFESSLLEVFSTIRNSELLTENHSFVLPKIEFSNPLNWTIIVHEAGHLNVEMIAKIKDDPKILPDKLQSINEKILKNWAEEIYCDIFAISLIGPAYFLSFASYALLSSLDYGISSDSELHPSVVVRATIMLNYLKDNELFFKEEWGINDYCKIFYQGLMHNGGILQDTSKIEIEGLTKFNRNLRKSIKSLNLCDFKISEVDTKRILDLVSNLKNGIPIGSVNDQDRMTALRDINNSDSAELIEVWKGLVSERSSTLWEILNAGWIYKLEESCKIGNEIFFNVGCENEDIMDKIDMFGVQIDFLDDRMLASINSSLIIKIIES